MACLTDGVGNPLLPPITFPVVELAATGDLSFDQTKESRIRVFLVQSSDGCPLRPHHVANPDLTVPNALNWDWNIGQFWRGALETSDTGVPAVTGSLLTVQRVTITQLTNTTLKVVAAYDTNPAQWRWKRRAEVVTESGTLFRDLDARDFFAGGCPGNFSVLDAKDWCQHVAGGNKVPGDEYIISATEGVDVPIPRYNLVYSGILPDASDLGAITGIGGLVSTQNASEFFTGTGDQQKWLLKSFNAEEIKVVDNSDVAVWRVEIRFEFDSFWHRKVVGLRKDGGLSNKGATTGTGSTERLRWRSHRVNEVVDWGALPAGIPA